MNVSKNDIKYIQSLANKKFRQEHGVYLAEGTKVINDLLNGYSKYINGIYALKDWADFDLAQKKNVAVTIVEPFEMAKMSQLQTPASVLAVVHMESSELKLLAAGKWTLVLDGIQDPGNLGSIIRLADWFGIENIICSADTVDCYNPKVVQAAMGSLWRVKIHYSDLKTVLHINMQLPVYGTLLNGDNLFQTGVLQPGIIIIGNEGKGIRPENLSYISKAITIPKYGEAESLNAAIATGIVLAACIGKHA
mgnify:FL=1